MACIFSLQSFLVRPCFCLSPDIYLYLCCTSCCLCLHDIRPKPFTCPRQRWENVRQIKMAGLHSVRLTKKTPPLSLVNGAFYNYNPHPCGQFIQKIKSLCKLNCELFEHSESMSDTGSKGGQICRHRKLFRGNAAP